MSSIEAEWKKEFKKDNPSLFFAMFRANFWIIPRITLISAFGYGAKTVMPFVLSELIDWFSDESGQVLDAYLWALLYGGLALGASWILAPMLYQNMTDGHLLRCQLCSLLYRKCLNMNAEGRRAITIGKIVNIMSVDVGRCDRIFMPFSQVSVAVPIISISLWQIYTRMGSAVYGALGAVLFFTILNIVEGKILGNFRAIIAKKTDRRVRLLEEMISAMRIIKMYVWEGFSLNKIMN